MTDVEKIRAWLEEAKKTNTDYSDDCEDLKKLVSIAIKLLDVCEEWQSEIAVSTSSGVEYPVRKAIEECAKEIE